MSVQLADPRRSEREREGCADSGCADLIGLKVSIQKERWLREQPNHLFLPTGLAESFEYMRMVLRPPPRRASADIKVEGGRCHCDTSVEGEAGFFSSIELPQRSGKPTMGQRIFGVGSDHPLRRCDYSLVFVAEVMRRHDLLQTDRQHRAPGIEPDVPLECR